MGLPFKQAEYDTRLLAIRTEMERRGFELLVVTDVANQHYVTGYDGWSFYTPQVVLVPAEHGEPIWIGRAMDAAGGRLTAWMSPENIVGYPEHLVQQPDRHPMDWTAGWIVARGWGSRRIGIELDAYYYSPRAHMALVAGLPDSRIEDASLLVNWIRAIKSDAEIGYLRDAARLAEAGMRAAHATIRPGTRECDAIAAIQAAQVAGSPHFAGDITALPPTILGGVNASAPHIMWSDRRFGADETVALELAGACRRYTAGLARTMQLGRAPAAVDDMARAVSEGMEAVLDGCRAGVTAESVEAAWRGVLGRYGLEKASRIGYSIGVAYPPDWGEHTISLRPGDRTVLQTGNVLHAILGMWMDGWGLELSETILVKERDCETLTSFPRTLFRVA